MSRLWRWLKLLILAGLAFLVLYVVFALLYLDFMVDLWWFGALGYEAYFWLRLTYRYLIFGGFTLLFFLIFFLNFWVASRFLGTSPASGQNAAALSRTRSLMHKFRSGSLKVYTPFSLALAVLLAWPFFQRWEEALLFLFAPASGLTDPVFGKDISYFLFSLPIYLSVLNTLLMTLGLLFLGLLLLYWLERRVLSRQALRLPPGAKVHLSVLVFLMFLVGVWDFWLQRQSLLYTTSHAGLFFGPGFVEMRVILPLIWLSLLCLLGTAIALIFYINARRGLRALVLVTSLFFVVLWARYSPFLPNLVDQYIVKPNEISRERPYIEKNIQATLAAYDLDRVERREYTIEEVPWDLNAPKVKINLRNIPVWDREVLQDVYQQLQELRTYYRFTSVDVDRYTVNNVYQQVFLAPRELSLENLPSGVRNWINERLKYTHGYGVVMTPAAQGGEEPMTWFIQDIPPRSDFGFTIEQPGIYYGLSESGYVIAPNDSQEIDYPIEEGNKLTDYQGRSGVPVHSLFRKLIFSVYFQERGIFFTAKTNEKSRLLFRRNIVERIKTLTPFFRLDEDPYIVVTKKGLFWIQDAYTSSDRYPFSERHKQGLNYIRNSVKIVVDAYNGTVDYYLADPRDPIIQAYSRMYPGLLKSLDQMPADLKSHLRYPKDLFEIQMEIYAKYHQTDPEVFYKQEDLLEFPQVQHGGLAVRVKPYYLTLNLIDREKFEFISICPMTPRARDNLRALCVVGCDGGNYGKILVYTFPKGLLVYGPSQVDAFIDQDTQISEQLTLWNQMGSQVERGRMILLPVRGAILYIQPVYLKASAGVKIPQLKRLIINKGEVTVMEPSLEQGLAKLDQRLRGLAERAKQRLERFQPPAGSPPGTAPPAQPEKPPAPPQAAP
jgi:uncharacterized protein